MARAISRPEASGFDPTGRNPHLIGLAYATGRGRPGNPRKALAFFERSCRAGWSDACAQLEETENRAEPAP